MKKEDAKLLECFLARGDQKAFAELVQRYVDMAYSVAYAYLGTEDLACDAVQLTFVELARKASSLSQEVKLGGWVYAVSRNFARKVQRSEVRRMQREQQYANNMNTMPSAEVDWEHALPEIHDAMDELKPIERDVIRLRFFEERSFSEVGGALGLSGDAARMRLNRALDQLNIRLQQRGITSTAAALAAALPAYAVVQAPVGLAPTITTAALAGAGSAVAAAATLTGTIGVMMKAKSLSLAVAAVLAVVGGSVYFAVADRNVEKSERAGHAKPTVLQVEEALHEEVRPNASAASEQRVLAVQGKPSSESRESRSAGGILDQSAELGLAFDQYQAFIDSHAEFKAKQFLDRVAKDYLSGNTNRVLTALSKVATADVNKLRLRLGLSPRQCELFHAMILKHHFSRRIDCTEAEKARSVLEHREALQCMLGLMYTERIAPETATPESKAFGKRIQQLLIEKVGYDPVGKETRKGAYPWEEDEAAWPTFLEVLEPAQQDEFMVYVKEVSERRFMQLITNRVKGITNHLGLDAEEERALFDYIREHPDATKEEVKQFFDPELHELFDEAPWATRRA